MSYTLAQAAARLGCAPLTVSRYINRGLLKADKGPGRNGAVRVRPEWIDEFLAEQEVIGTQTLSTAQAAKVLFVTERTVERLVACGELATRPAHGRGARIDRNSLLAYARARRAQTPPPVRYRGRHANV